MWMHIGKYKLDPLFEWVNSSVRIRYNPSINIWLFGSEWQNTIGEKISLLLEIQLFVIFKGRLM